MKRRIILIALILACSLLMCSCDLSSIQASTEETSETKNESSDGAETEIESEFDKLAYGKTTISGDILYIYELLVDKILARTPAAKINFDNSRNITEDEFSKALDIFYSDHPECFWWAGEGRYSGDKDAIDAFFPQYSMKLDDIPAKRAELDAVVDEVLKGVPEGSAFDKALYLHDKVAEMVEYKSGTHDQTPYGALVLGEAVCSGYSTAYQLLLMKSGIRAWTVYGYSEEVPHAWTVVWLDDDTCVYTDVTWDDQDEHGIILRNYFNMSLDEIDDDHTVDSVFVLPECDHDNEGYYETIGAVVDDSDNMDKIVELFGAEENGERIARFYYKGSDFNVWFDTNVDDILTEIKAESLEYYMFWDEIILIASN